jgi:hypothetical protein
MTNNLEMIPLRRKGFASLLRSHLATDKEKNRVRIVAQRAVIIYGINLIDKKVE